MDLALILQQSWPENKCWPTPLSVSPPDHLPTHAQRSTQCFVLCQWVCSQPYWSVPSPGIVCSHSCPLLPLRQRFNEPAHCTLLLQSKNSKTFSPCCDYCCICTGQVTKLSTKHTLVPMVWPCCRDNDWPFMSGQTTNSADFHTDLSDCSCAVVYNVYIDVCQDAYVYDLHT